jgi:hypothetical protein
MSFKQSYQAGFAGALIVTYGVIVFWPGVMTFFGLPLPFGHWFVDLHSVLASSDALAAGLDPYRPNPLDILHATHWYSHWWFWLHDLGLTRADTSWLGKVLGAGFLAATIWVVRPGNFLEMLLAWALACSPAVVLGFNRANSDFLIYIVLAALAWALASRHRPLWLLGAPVVALLGGLKFYPLAGGVALVLAPRPAAEVRASLGFMALLSVLVGLGVYKDLIRIVPLIDECSGLFIFAGSQIFVLAGLPVTVAKIMTLLCGVLMAGLWWRHLPVAPAMAPAHEKTAFGLGAILILGCFFTGNSYSYRLVFTLLMLPLLWTWSRQEVAGGIARLTLGLMLPLAWIDGLVSAMINAGWTQRLGIATPTAELAGSWLAHAVSWVWVSGICGLLLALYRPAVASLFARKPF